MSKYRPTVVLEKKLTKDAMKTMGPAKVEVPSPERFLKKHSKEPKLPQSEFCCRLFEPRVGSSVSGDSVSSQLHVCVCAFRNAVFQRRASHLHREESSGSLEDGHPAHGHPHHERLHKDGHGGAHEAPADLRGHPERTQAAP